MERGSHEIQKESFQLAHTRLTLIDLLFGDSLLIHFDSGWYSLGSEILLLT